MFQRIPICDLDGTLIDSDLALAAAFRSLGVDEAEITYGHVLAEECIRLGLRVEDYLDAYDPMLVEPFPGVEELLLSLDRWAVCSNKHPRSGWAELDRFGWTPDLALFADSFDGPKRLGPVLDRLGLSPEEVLFVGDTDHDRNCAAAAGVQFALAGWNPRAEVAGDELVLTHPLELIELLR